MYFASIINAYFFLIFLFLMAFSIIFVMLNLVPEFLKKNIRNLTSVFKYLMHLNKHLLLFEYPPYILGIVFLIHQTVQNH